MWAVIPVKSMLNAKQRLSSALDVRQREQLCLSMLNDVLAALDASKHISQIVIITQEPIEQLNVIKTPLHFLQESPRCQNLNQAVDEAVEFVAQQASGDVFVLHGDLPLLTGPMLDKYLSEFIQADESIYLFGDKTQQGTNALLFNACQKPEFLFGENSQQLHLAEYKKQQQSVRLVNDTALAFDIDEPEDLLQLLNHDGLAESTQTFQLLQSLKYQLLSNGLQQREVRRCC